MGYITLRAGIALWILGLCITATALYLVYWAAIPRLPSFPAELLAMLIVTAGVAILGFWGFVLSRGISEER